MTSPRPDNPRALGPKSIPRAILTYVFGWPGFRQEGYSVVGDGGKEDEEEDDDNGKDDGKDSEKGEDDDEKEDFKQVDIPEDAYGAAILALVRDFPLVCCGVRQKASDGGLPCVSFTFGITLLFINLVLQLSILWYVYQYVVKLDINMVQEQYGDFRQKVFDSTGQLQEHLWMSYDKRGEMCDVAMWNKPFYYSVLFCWTLTMMTEIRRSEDLLRNVVIKVPQCKKYSEQMRFDGDDIFVVALTKTTRMLLFIIVCVPKLFISFVLLWLGCEWLSATTKFENLVMNTVAMAFIVNIDELLVEAILPKVHRNEVADINFLIKRPARNDAKAQRAAKRSSYARSTIYCIFAGCYIVLYAEYLQDVLPKDIVQVQQQCRELMESNRPKCSGWTWRGQGMPLATDCFPYPNATQTPRSSMPTVPPPPIPLPSAPPTPAELDRLDAGRQFLRPTRL